MEYFIQGRKQDFFRAGEFSWNKALQETFYLQDIKERPHRKMSELKYS